MTLPNATAMKSRVIKLADKYPDEVKILATNPDGSIFANVPVRYVKISRPREVSEEQAAAAGERFRKMWADERDNEETEEQEEHYLD